MTFLKEFLRFLSHNKKLWLAPVLLVILLIGGLLMLASHSPLAPFIYVLFLRSDRDSGRIRLLSRLRCVPRG